MTPGFSSSWGRPSRPIFRSFLVQNPLRTPDLPFPRCYPSCGHPNRHRQCLKRTLRPMMIILSPQHIHMQRNPRILRKRPQTVRDHFRRQVTDFFALETFVQVGNEEGAVGKVDDGAREGFIKGGVGAAEAGKARRCGEGGFEGGAKGEAGIFGCVVIIDYTTLY